MFSNIFIIIPAFNEEKHISDVVNELLILGYYVIVVDDGYADRTAELARAAGAVVLCHKINRGQGAALATGTLYALRAGAEIMVHFDGDGQFLSSEIKTLIEPLARGEVDIVLGSRFFKYANGCELGRQINANKNMPFLKKYFILPTARILNYFLTGLKLTDAHCGLRAMNRLAAAKIKIDQDGMAHNTEIVAQIKKNNLRWRELPVTVIYHEFGQGIGGGVKILKDLFIKKMIK